MLWWHLVVVPRCVLIFVGILLSLRPDGSWGLSAPGVAPRHLCLVNSYATVQGPYFTALIHQLAEQAGHNSDELTMMVCHGKDDSQISINEIKDDLQISNCYDLVLEDYNPVSLEEAMVEWRHPQIVWVVGSNAFRLRYQLRTSGLDRWIENHCASSSASAVYVGEGAGAICAGSLLKIAHALGHDRHGAPEPQFVGMNLLGPHKSIGFANLSTEEKLSLRSQEPDFDDSSLDLLGSDKVFVWAQSRCGSDASDEVLVANFVFLPTQKGTMEQMRSPEPLLAIVGDDDEEGVPCYGEPSIDPSRRMQRIGDSEWMEELE